MGAGRAACSGESESTAVEALEPLDWERRPPDDLFRLLATGSTETDSYEEGGTIMGEIQTLLKFWEFSYLDVSNALKDVQEEHLHVRLEPNALAISEIVAHISYCEAQAILSILLGKPKERWGIQSPLFDDRNWYPPEILARPIRSELQALSISDVATEFNRVHEFVRAAAQGYDVPAATELKGAWGNEPTVRSHLSYVGYHVAYHVGQIYLTRHLLGETTPEQA
jgi:hypothetical protein